MMGIRNVILCFLLNTLCLTVVQAQVTDQIYYSTREKLTVIPDAFCTEHMFPAENIQNGSRSLATDLLLAKSPPFEFGECIMLSASNRAFNANGEFNLFGNDTSGKHKPPSLRFYVSDTLSSIDLYGRLRLFGNVSRLSYARTFWMKKTEVTNKEYREFVMYVRDSIARRALCDGGFDNDYTLDEKEYMKKYNLTYDQIDSAYPEPAPLDWSVKVQWNSPNPDYRAALDYMYLPKGERYYVREIDTRKLLYVFYDKRGGKKYKIILNIYPDTLCWINQFPNNDRAEMYTNMYFWHPKFDDYPVVGINYDQAKAFLHWKTEMEYQKKSKKQPHWKAIYSIPTEIEWETAVTASMSEKNTIVYPDDYAAKADFSWYCDLQLHPMKPVLTKHRELIDSFKTYTIKKPSNNFGGYIYSSDGVYKPVGIEFDDTTYSKGDTTFTLTWKYKVWYGPPAHQLREVGFELAGANEEYPFCTPADLSTLPLITKTRKYSTNEIIRIDNSKIKTHISNTGFSWLDGNVSEWIDADFAIWQNALRLKLQQLKAQNSEEGNLASALMDLYSISNANDDKLIRGANWYDCNNPNGAQAKCFREPLQSFSTVGFRYVIHLVPLK